MTYKGWVRMNIKYESLLLAKIKKEHGKASKKYKVKADQIQDLKQSI